MSAPLTVAEVAKSLGVDRSTITRWIAAGKIPTIGKLPGVNGAHLFEREVIERLVKDGRKP